MSKTLFSCQDAKIIGQFSGLSSGPPVLMILELVPLGSMLDFLKDHPDSVREDMEIPLWVSTTRA